MKNTVINRPGAVVPDPEDISSVETIVHNGELICILIPARPTPKATKFYTPASAPVQVGKIVYRAGSEIAPHKHGYAPRSVTTDTEVLYVQSGRMAVDLYASDDSFVCAREVSEGDVLVLIAGGHGFRFNDDTILVEVRQGTFSGSSDRQQL